jgi:hypothetical protein
MSNIQPQNTSYGLSQAIIVNAPSPIAAKRNPNTNDFMQIGTIWSNINTDAVYILASIVNNLANWVSVAGGAGFFSSLVVTGNTTLTGITTLVGTTNINTAGGAATSIGTGTGAVTIGNATSGVTFPAGNVTIGNGNLVFGTNLTTVEFHNGIQVFGGAGNPNGVVVAAQGSLFLNHASTGPNDRMFINTDGAMAWTYFAANA